ncbi:hypothetical protein JOE52_001477 [Bradyrhizobium canariense]|nr:hypothetical protein [Bradyrhizobium canariense]
MPVVPKHFCDLGEHLEQQHASMSRLPRLTRSEDRRTGLCEASRRLGQERRVPDRHRSHDLFCIRLHFVRKERIGVEKSSAKRSLTIGEGARDCLLSSR